MTQSTQLTEVKAKVQRLRSLLENPQNLTELTKALPPELTPERVVRQCLTLVQTTPKLILCSPTSILIGLFQACELGLILNGVLGQAYLIPRKYKDGTWIATFQMGYQGYIELAWRSPRLLSFAPQTVHERDQFEIRLGTNRWIKHVPVAFNAGPAIGYYATATFAPQGVDFVYMTREQVEEHRQRFADPSSRAWRDHFDAMAEVTCMRKLGRRLPKGSQVAAAAAADTPEVRHKDEQEQLDDESKYLDCMNDGEISEEEEDAARKAASDILDEAGVPVPPPEIDPIEQPTT